MKNKIIQWLLVGVGLTGAVLNARGNVAGFYCWIVSNTAFAYVNFRSKTYAQMTLWLIYDTISVYGIYSWTQHGNH